MRIFFLVISVAILMGCTSASESKKGREISKPTLAENSSWLDHPQIYTNLGVSPDTARRLGVTVNGLWNGWGMKNPVASMHPSLLFWKFKKEKDYVARFHEAGFLHGSTLSCAYARKELVNSQPDLKQAVCKTIDGEDFVLDGGWYLGKHLFMCQNSPAWHAALLERAISIIDAGSDALVLDEPFGETYFNGLPIPGFPGFSDFDIAALAEDLGRSFSGEELETNFGLADLELNTIRSRFNDIKMNLSPSYFLPSPQSDKVEASPFGRLWLYYKDFQRRKNLETKKLLVEKIRAYGEQTRGRSIPIGANLAELDAYFSIGQLPVLYMAGLYDFLAFETAYRPSFEERAGREGAEAFTLSERGKWLPVHALGEAIVGPYRSLAYPSQELVDAWMEPGNKINYLCHLFAEAYAARGGLIIPMWDFKDKDEEKLGLYTQFVRRNPDFFDKLMPVERIGVLYAHGEESTAQHWSYLGISQALYESGMPFSVVYTSTDYLERYSLSRSKLEHFRILIIPIDRTLTAGQRAEVTRYVEEDGGKVVLFGTNSNFPVSSEAGIHDFGKGSFIVLGDGGSNGIGNSYYFGYDDEIRTSFAAAIRSLLGYAGPIEVPNTTRTWAVLAYAQPHKDRSVLHVLNYAYDPENDYFEKQRRLSIRVNLEDFGLAGELSCRAYSPERPDPITLTVVAAPEGYVEISLPELEQYEVLVLE